MLKGIDQQLKHNDCGISAVKIVYNLHNIPVNRSYIEENIYLDEKGSGIHDIKEFFDKEQFLTSFNLLDVNTLKFNPEKLEKLVPCILPIKNKQGQHYVVIQGVRNKKLQILDPAIGQSHTWTSSELLKNAYTASANYDYVSNKQIFETIIHAELSAYKISVEKAEEFDQGEIVNKLTYFSYLKENFGFANVDAEKKFLEDLLFNQELNILPKQFRAIKIKNEKLKISSPVVLTVHRAAETKIVTANPNNVAIEKPVNPYRKLVAEMKPYRKLWVIFIASALFSAFIGQLTIFTSQILIDNILPSYNLSLLILFAVGVAIFNVFRLIISTYKKFISIHLANIFDNYFLTSFSDKLNSLSIRYIHTFSKGDLTERVKDSMQLKTFFIQFFTNIIIDAFVALYSLIILFALNWKIALIVVLVLVIFTIWFYVITPYIRENEKRRFLEKSSLFSSLFENIEGLQVIKSFRLEGLFMQRLAPKIKSILAIQKKMKYVNLVNSGVIDFIMIIAGAFILVLLSRNAIVDKSISVGQIITFLALAGQVFSSVSGILSENLDLQENSIILNRYFDFGKTTADNQPLSLQSKIKSFDLESVEFRNVGFFYIPHKPVFTNLNVVINRGDKIQLEGNNGAGKSTFCKVLSLLYNPNSGDIFINNEKHHFYNAGAVRKKILLVSNEDILFNDTLGYNITFNYASDTSEILLLAKEVGLYDFISDKAEGLDFIINEQGRNLSTGQRKKVLMMRAFMSGADVIILDETLSGIDKESKEKIERFINKQKDSSFIIISHEPLEHLKFTKTLLMQNGTINELQHQGI